MTPTVEQLLPILREFAFLGGFSLGLVTSLLVYISFKS